MSAILVPSSEPQEVMTEHPHVVRLGAVAHIRGTRLPVRVIAQLYRSGDLVEDILRAYPHLTATAIHDALSYYLDHRAEIEQEIAAQRLPAALAATDASVDSRGYIKFGSGHG